MNMDVLVTGADGFVGKALCGLLEGCGYRVRRVTRTKSQFDSLVTGDIGSFDGWASAVHGVDSVIHLAARAHILKDDSRDPLKEFRRVNVTPTERLIRAAINADVRRFIYVSSIGVHGSASGSSPFTEHASLWPEEPYAISKYETEVMLRGEAGDGSIELVIVRPPLVYGCGARGNFLRLMRLVDLRVPIPIGKVANLRSFVGLENLCDFLQVCISHPSAAGHTLVVRDGYDVSTAKLVHMIGDAMGRNVRTPRVPLPLVREAARIFGLSAELRRLLQSLQVDDTGSRTLLGWEPSVTMDQGIRTMTACYRDSKNV